MSRGYFGIGIWNPQHECNIGTLFRSAYSFGANFLFTIGRKYARQSSDTVKSFAHIPFFNYLDSDDFFNHLPLDVRVIAVETNGKPINNFVHPERAIYLLGSENQTLPDKILKRCYYNVRIETPNPHCLNVSVAGSLLLFHRNLNIPNHIQK